MTTSTATPPLPTSGNDLPRPFGRYTLEELVGEGGEGQVFRAVLHGPSGFAKPVALKMLKTRNQDYLHELFQREARIGGWLHHPNVVEIYDFGSQGSVPFLAMEFIDGWSLDRFLARHPGPPPTVILDLAIQIARGLQHAHELVVDGAPLRLIHRDLKPANVLVNRRGGVKVVDFGLARPMHTDKDPGLTSVHMLVGTPAYMSPEQPIAAEDLDLRSDIFAFGVVLYEVVTGRHPWPRKSLLERLNALNEVDKLTSAPDFWDLPRQCLPGVERILERCLSANPANRFDDTRALVSALRTLQRERPPGPDLRAWLQDRAEGSDPDEPERAALPRGIVASNRDAAVKDPAPAPGPDEIAPPPPTGRREAPQATEATPHNLPPDRDTFIGRQEDVAQLLKRLDQNQRLITLLGPGGTGKTRLSLRLGSEAMDRFPGGVFFCDLTEARSSAGIVSAAATALSIPLSSADPLTQLDHAFGGRGRILVLFDNFEQIVEFAGETVGRWLDQAPEASFLVTSRTRLGIRGESVFDLAPLPTEDAIELFFARAQAVRPVLTRTPENTPSVAKIVEKLDRLPLAIELAAARSRVLLPEKLLARLSDRFRLLQAKQGNANQRQATLRGALDWSWQLLRPWEQLALAQTSVFRGGLTLESAEAVLDLDAFDEAPWPLDVVESLVDQSLLRPVEPHPGHPRYRLLESIQLYAAEKLEILGDQQATQLRHLEHYADMGEVATEALRKHGGSELSIALRLEFENLVQGMASGDALGRPTSRAECAWAASQALEISGRLSEALEVLDQVPRNAFPPQRAATLPLRRAWLKLSVGKTAESRPLIDMALHVAREIGDRSSEAGSLRLLGDARTGAGTKDDTEPGRSHYEEALSIYRELGDRRGEASVVLSLGTRAVEAGQIDRAVECFEQARVIFQSLGDLSGEASCLNNLGGSLPSTQAKRAREALGKALNITRSMGNRRLESKVRLHLGNIEMETGQAAKAQQHYEHGLAIARETGSHLQENLVLHNLGFIYSHTGQLDRAQDCFERALSHYQKFGNRREEALARSALGTIQLELGRADQAVENFEHSTAVFRDFGNVRAEVVDLGELGDALMQQGNLTQAEASQRKAVELCRFDASPGVPDGPDPFAFYGGLALTLAHSGQFDAAHALIDEAAPRLKRKDPTKYGHLLCRQAKIHWLAGNARSAHASLDRAQAVAQDLGDAPRSPLERAIERAEQFCSDGP